MANIVLTDILRFFMVYTFVVIGFAFGFHVLLMLAYKEDELQQDMPQPQPQSLPSGSGRRMSVNMQPVNALSTLFTNLRLFMSPSEIIEDEIFSRFPGPGPLLYVRTAFLFYSFFSGLILINILIAMMNDSYTRVSATERITWRVTSLRQAMYVFRAFPFVSWIVNKTLKNEGQILSSSPSYRKAITLYHIRCELPPLTEPVKTEMAELEALSKEVRLLVYVFSDV